AVVVLHEAAGRPQLIGYVAGSGLDPEDLQAALQQRLPAYLVPSRILVLDRLPRTRHGKVDRAALPAPERERVTTVAPRTTTETQLAAIWQAVLGLETVGVSDNFFALGGDSILSLQVVSRARAAGYALSPKDLFRHQTLAALAAVAQPLATTAFDPGPVTGAVPLTPIQAEFFATAIPARHHWNQSLLLQPKNPLQADALAAALDDLQAHHASLRLRYGQADGVWQQAYAEVSHSPDGLWYRPVADPTELATLADTAQRSLDLAQGPLLRAVLFAFPDGSQRLLLVVHHLVVDGVSWRLLLEDLQSAYQARCHGNACPLPAPTSSFKAWSQRLVRWAGSAELQTQQDYWLQQVPDLSPHWPCDDRDGSARNCDAATLAFSLPPTATAQLLQHAGAAYRTQIQDLLLTALVRAWRRWSGQAALGVELEGHGR
ncbi:condensation domain-containing protein, partial [Methylolobus aquaticus]